MHEGNRRFWQYCVENYPNYFCQTSVLEMGSLNINGSIREYFVDHKGYVGVDWRRGDCVDIVSFAHEIDLERQFDVVVSSSMLEHDVYWNDSIDNMVKHMSEEGILILTWGAAGCTPHSNVSAKDGKFHELPLINVVDQVVNKNGLHLNDLRYETRSFDGEVGCVCLVAFKSLVTAMHYNGVLEKLDAEDYKRV
jgi:SAM-dependent methyltransferase